MKALIGGWFGPYVSAALYAMDDMRILKASCLRCHERWDEGDAEDLYQFAARHDQAAHADGTSDE